MDKDNPENYAKLAKQLYVNSHESIMKATTTASLSDFNTAIFVQQKETEDIKHDVPEKDISIQDIPQEEIKRLAITATKEIDPKSNKFDLRIFAGKEENIFIDHLSDFPNSAKQPPAEPVKKGNGYTITPIMIPYEEFEPKYELIAEKLDKMKVYKITLNDKREFALKILIANENDRARINKILREYYIGRTFGAMSSYVAKAINLMLKKVEETKKIHVEMLLEYGGSNLSQLKERFIQENFLKISSQLVAALLEAEEIGIAHFDIKPENIVYDIEKQILKIIDFGGVISFYRSPEDIEKYICQNANKFHEFTEKYAPPEILYFKTILDSIISTERTLSKDKVKIINEIKGKMIIPQKVDAFCFGMTLAELMLGYENFEKIIAERKFELKSHEQFLLKIIANLENTEWKNFTKIISCCLDYLPERRPKFERIMKLFEKVLHEIKNDSLIIEARSKPIISFDLLTEMYIELHEFYEDALSSKSKLFEELDKEKTNAIKDEIKCVHHNLSAIINFAKSESKLNEAEKMTQIRECDSSRYSKLCSLFDEVYGGMEKHSDTLENLMKDMNICQKIFGEDLRCLAKAYFNEGIAYRGLGKYDISVEFLNKSLKFRKNIYGEEHPDVAEVYIQMGIVFGRMEKYDDAIEYEAKAINIFKKYFGEDYYRLSRQYANLGYYYEKKGKYDIAAEIYIEDMNITKKRLGQEHPNLANTYGKLGFSYERMLKYNIAVEYYIKEMNIIKKIYSRENSVHAGVYSELGSTFLNMEKFHIALFYFLKVKCIYATYLTPEHPNYNKLLNNIATTYSKMNYLKKEI